MGRKAKYKNDKERKEAQAEYQRQWRAKNGRNGKSKGKHPDSWIKTVEQKIEGVLHDEDVTPVEIPSGKIGMPFADLPPLELPTSSPTETTGDESSTTSTSDSSTADASSATTSTPTPKKSSEPFMDTALLEKMASQMVEDGVAGLGKYAAERGMMALGEPFPKVAGMCAAIIIRKRAVELGMPEEEVAAWVLGGVVGINSMQAARAFYAEKKKKEEEALRVERKSSPVQSPNGVSIPDEQRRAAEAARAERLAAEQRIAASGAIV